MKTTTIHDVAKLAGVSIKTVSRVINNEPSVKQNTRSKVEQAVKELDYQPNQSARNLASTASFEVGFIYDNPNAYYIIEMQNGILSECRKQGYELVIHPCNSNTENIIDELIAVVRKSRLAGLLLTPPLSENPQLIFALKSNNIPFVRIVSGSEAPDILSPCVYIDDRRAAFDISCHLLELGHRQIGFINGDKVHKSTDERLTGYKDALAEFGVAVNNKLIYDGNYSFEAGVNGAKHLLAQTVRPTAIFACNDEIAAGALFASRLLGLEVPQQLAIAGFEGSPFSQQTWPKLTTAEQPTQEIARFATSILLSHIKSRNAGAAQSQRFLPKLVIRASTQAEQ